jgi:hypothetical protein
MMNAIEQFNLLFPEFIEKFDPGDRPMVMKLISEIFKYPLSHRVYFRLAGYKVVPRPAFNDVNANQYAIDGDLERFVKIGLVEKSKNGFKLVVS